jgi:hypothetical protein
MDIDHFYIVFSTGECMSTIMMTLLGILSTLVTIRLFVLCIEDKQPPGMLLVNSLSSIYGLIGAWAIGMFSTEIQRFFINILFT